MLSADEFYEAVEPPSGDTAAAELSVEAVETTNDASDAAQSSHAIDDADKLSALAEGVTALLPENVAGGMPIVDDAAADIGDQNDNDESVSTECNRVLVLDGSEPRNSEQSQLSGDVRDDDDADSLQSDGVSQSQQHDSATPADSSAEAENQEVVDDASEVYVADDVSHLAQPDDAAVMSSDDRAHSQQPDTATPAHSTTKVESTEAGDNNHSQPSDDDDDVSHSVQSDDASSDNQQPTTCMSLPLHIAEEPSTADSNDDPADYVEASTSFNADDAGELYAGTEPVTDVKTHQSWMAGDAEQQLLEDDDNDDRDDEQFVDSTSDMSSMQPVEGDVGILLL